MWASFFKLDPTLCHSKPLRCIEPRCQCLEVGQQCFEWFWRRPEPLFVDLLYFGHGLNKNISTKHLAQPPESHIVLNRGRLCLVDGAGNGLCNGEQMGLGSWGGGGGGGSFLWFCRGEPGSQSGRWRNHLPTTSRHPPHTPDAPSTCDNSYSKSAYEKNLMASSCLFSNVTKIACHAGNRNYQTNLFTSGHVTQKVCTAERENKLSVLINNRQ